VFVKVCT